MQVYIKAKLVMSNQNLLWGHYTECFLVFCSLNISKLSQSTNSVTIKFLNWGHKNHKKFDKYLFISSLNIDPESLGTTFTSLIQLIDCPGKRFFLYCIEFSHHNLLYLWNSLESHQFHRNFLFRKWEVSRC